MPIKIPNRLPARAILKQEGVPIITESVALRQDIRPMQVLLLNLMPDKITTETQLLRALGHTPLQVEMTLLRTASYEGKNTAREHLVDFYQTHDEIKDRKFDALVVTGAPVEQFAFEDVDYWPELQKIFDWSRSHVLSSFFICWGAQAALYHFHGIAKHAVKNKQFGIYPHNVLDKMSPLTAGFDDRFGVPVSRHSEMRRKDILKAEGLEILVESKDAGVCLVQEINKRRFYMFNHLEYDLETLQREYDRDAKAGLSPTLPFNYFEGNDPAKLPCMSWAAHRHLLFGNWLNYVYQTTPYDISKIRAP